MGDSDRIVYPDEVEAARAECQAKSEAEKNVAENEIETGESLETPAEVTEVTVGNRNMIQAPGNCPAGYEMDANGVCREVF